MVYEMRTHRRHHSEHTSAQASPDTQTEPAVTP
jgi:hypothetical protein